MQTTESYHTKRVFSADEFSFAVEMLDTYPWIRRELHRRGFDEMIDRLILDGKERDLLRELLAHFVYLTEDDVEFLLSSIIAHIGEWGCTSNDTVFVALRNDPRDNDGSNIFLKQLQDRLYGWGKKNFVNFFDPAHRFSRVLHFSKVILIDDFIGTGGTVSGRLKTLKKTLEKSSPESAVYVVAMAAMKVAKVNHPELGGDDVFAPLWLDGAFERGTDVDRTDLMDNILARLDKRNNDCVGHSRNRYGYGYGDTAGLYYNVHYRIPNNVLSLFWWGCFKKKNNRKEVYHSMFRRS